MTARWQIISLAIATVISVSVAAPAYAGNQPGGAVGNPSGGHSSLLGDCGGGPLDCPAEPLPCDQPGGGGGGGPVNFCNVDIDTPSIGRQRDAYSPSADVGFGGEVACDGGTIIVSAQTQVVDRTPGYSGTILADGGAAFGGSYARTTGWVRLYDEDRYPSAQQIEVQLVVDLAGTGWECNPNGPGPGLHWVTCRDDGYIVVATGTFGTGLQSQVDQPDAQKKRLKAHGWGSTRQRAIQDGLDRAKRAARARGWDPAPCRVVGVEDLPQQAPGETDVVVDVDCEPPGPLA